MSKIKAYSRTSHGYGTSSVSGARTLVRYICVLPYCNKLVAICDEVCVHGKGQLVMLIPAENQ